MHPSTRRAMETIERVEAALERAADQPQLDETWQPKEAECAEPEYRTPPRTKSHNAPARARDEKPRDEATRAYIERRLEQIVEMIGSESGANHRKLQEEIGQLRAEIAVLRTLLQASQEAARLRAEVAELKSARDGVTLDLPSLRPGH